MPVIPLCFEKKVFRTERKTGICSASSIFFLIDSSEAVWYIKLWNIMRKNVGKCI